MAWIILACAGLLETVWAFYMKKSDGFTQIGPSIITLLAMLASFSLLALAMRSLPLGTAYAVWTGIGTLGALILGVVFLGEQTTPTRMLAASLILGGLVLMKVSGGDS